MKGKVIKKQVKTVVPKHDKRPQLLLWYRPFSTKTS